MMFAPLERKRAITDDLRLRSILCTLKISTYDRETQFRRSTNKLNVQKCTWLAESYTVLSIRELQDKSIV